MQDIFTQQPDIVTAATDLVISIMAAVFAGSIIKNHTIKNIVRQMCIMLFAAVFAAGLAGAVLHGIEAVNQSFAAEQCIRAFTAAALGAAAVPVVYLCMYCAAGRRQAACLGAAALILWIVAVAAVVVLAAKGNRAFGPVYIYSAVCIGFAAVSGAYCMAVDKAREMIYLLVSIAAAGIGILLQNLIAEDKILKLIVEFNHSGLAHIVVIAVMPLTYIWCDRLLKKYK